MPTAGGVAVTVTGVNFGPLVLPTPYTYSLEYTGAALSRVFTSPCNTTVADTTMACRSAVGVGGPFLVRAVIADVQSVRTVGPWSNSSQWLPPPPFQYDVPAVAAVSPQAGALQGGTHVVLSGANFGVPALVAPLVQYQSAGVGAWLAAADFSHTQLNVTTSPCAVVGNRSVTVDVHGRVGLLYFSVFNVTGAAPRYGPEYGGTTVTITGGGFTTQYVPLLRVGPGGVAVTGVVLNWTTIQFVTPPGMPVGDFGLQVNLNGADWLAVPNGRFHVYRRPVLLATHPMSGPITGGTNVTLRMQAFVTGVVTVRYAFPGGPSSVVLQTCTYVNDSSSGGASSSSSSSSSETDVTTITCVTPPTTVPFTGYLVVPLSVSTDTRDTVTGYSLPVGASEFVLYATPWISGMDPVIAPAFTAATTLTVTGQFVATNDTFTASFRNVGDGGEAFNVSCSVVAAVGGSGVGGVARGAPVAVLVPLPPTTLAGDYTVYVAPNGQQYTSAGIFLRVFGLLAFEPHYAPLHGSLVRVFATNFPIDTVVLFNLTVGGAVTLHLHLLPTSNNTVLEFNLPVLPAAVAGDAVVVTATFAAHGAASLTNGTVSTMQLYGPPTGWISPRSGPLVGGTNVTLTCNGSCPLTGAAQLVLLPLVAPGAAASYATTCTTAYPVAAVCETGPLAIGTYNVTFSVDDPAFVADPLFVLLEAQAFLAYRLYSLTGVAPNSVDLLSGGQVLLLANDLTPTGEESCGFSTAPNGTVTSIIRGAFLSQHLVSVVPSVAVPSYMSYTVTLIGQAAVNLGAGCANATILDSGGGMVPFWPDPVLCKPGVGQGSAVLWVRLPPLLQVGVVTTLFVVIGANRSSSTATVSFAVPRGPEMVYGFVETFQGYNAALWQYPLLPSGRTVCNSTVGLWMTGLWQSSNVDVAMPATVATWAPVSNSGGAVEVRSFVTFKSPCTSPSVFLLDPRQTGYTARATVDCSGSTSFVRLCVEAPGSGAPMSCSRTCSLLPSLGAQQYAVLLTVTAYGGLITSSMQVRVCSEFKLYALQLRSSWEYRRVPPPLSFP